MSRKSAIFLTSALVSASLIGNPIAAEAGTLSHNGTAIHQTLTGNEALRAALSCGGSMGHPGQVGTPSGHMGGGHMGGGPQIFAPVSVNQNINQTVNVNGSSNVNSNVNGQNFNVRNNGGNTTIVNKPITVQTNIDNSKNIDINSPVTVNNNIDASKNISINKPVTVTNNITNVKNVEINKSIEIYKPVTINKTIDNSKNININKNVNINANTNTNINSNSNNNTTTVTDNSVSNSTSTSNSYSTSTGYASAYADASSNAVSSSLGGGDIAISAAVDYVAKGGQCSFVDATVVKAIHAICVSADGREFPASHMVGTSWIASGYEGEIARCLPGSTLKVMIGSVVQSDQGLAASINGAETLTCGVHQAVRHYKDGMLKCAPAVKVVDCTERTNLRKWGTGDMFFSYVTKVCLDQTLKGGQSRETSDQAAARARQAYSHNPAGYNYGSADAAIDRRATN